MLANDCWMAFQRLMLRPDERREPTRRRGSRSVRAENARRTDVILRSARARNHRTFGMQPSYVERGGNQFRQGRLSGLVAQHRKRKARANGAALETQSAGVEPYRFPRHTCSSLSSR